MSNRHEGIGDAAPLRMRPEPKRKSTTAVILAAGRGRRMGSVTERRPKCLLPVGGQTVIEHQLTTLSALGVSKIAIATGYGSDQVRATVNGRASCIENEHWADTNSLYSLALCRDAVQKCESLVVLNGDVIAHPAILERVLTAPSSAFAYDSTSGKDQEHMKVELRGDRLQSMSKMLPPARVHGENVGILHFQGSAAELLFQETESVLRRGGREQWVAAAVQRVAHRSPIYGLDIANLPWCEIDFPEDLIAARSTTWPALCASPWTPAIASRPRRPLRLQPIPEEVHVRCTAGSRRPAR